MNDKFTPEELFYETCVILDSDGDHGEIDCSHIRGEYQDPRKMWSFIHGLLEERQVVEISTSEHTSRVCPCQEGLSVKWRLQKYHNYCPSCGAKIVWIDSSK